MRVCQLFSVSVVALAVIGMGGCAATTSAKATGLTGANSPLYQAMQQASQDGYAKQGR